jgi:hypothetical protein
MNEKESVARRGMSCLLSWIASIELLVNELHPDKVCPKSFQTVTAISFELLQALCSSESELLEEEINGSLTGIFIIITACVSWLVISKENNEVKYVEWEMQESCICMDSYLPFVEDTLEFLHELLSVLSLLKSILSNDLLELFASAGELTGDLESRWQKVVVVNKLDKWLDL